MESANFPYLLWIALLPLLGASLLAVAGTRLDRRLVHAVALGAVAGAFALTVWATVTLLGGERPLEATAWTWMSTDRYTVALAFRFDQLTAALMLVVTGVGFLIHVYSTEYMHEDPGYARYFAYLNFFIAAMSTLVLGASLPVMFIGWEGVGLASYLLIGFWFTDVEKAAAGKKAFITNRVGDFGFLLGTFTFFGLFGTGDFVELKALMAGLHDLEAMIPVGIFAGWAIRDILTFGCLMLFVGACGKSAQFPLYVWLPDAMAGPTPVSALIHAATMVTSGVYMVSRMGFAFDAAPLAGDTVAWVGALTALFAASIGLAQNDIKKVLAYSTVSQLGYMFIAAGLGAYGAAMFHVVTHAFFKACLFLGSGAVIHALHGEQDMRRMGDLLRRLPVVSATFLISTLAIAGVPFFSGFFSKDAILAYAFQEKPLLWAVGFLAAGMTAFYMMRLFALTFLGNFRFIDHEGNPGHVHVPHLPMRVPLVILAGLALFGGWMSIPHAMAEVLPGHPPADWFFHFLAPASGGELAAGGAHGAHHGAERGAGWILRTPLHLSSAVEWGLMAASVLWAGALLAVAYALYRNGPSDVMARLTAQGPGRVAHTLVFSKWFVDEIYQFTVVGPLRLMSSIFAVAVDPWLIDRGAVKGPAYLIRGAGRVLSRLQTGNVQSYAVVFVLGVAAIVLWTVR